VLSGRRTTSTRNVTLKHGGWIDHVPQPKSFPPTPQDVFDHWRKTGVVWPYNECAQMTEFQHKVISFWIHHPGDKAKLVPLDAQWLWQPSVVETRGRPGAGSWLDTVRTTAEPAYMIVLYILGLIGLFLVPRFLASLTVVLLGYQTLVAMLFVGETRYRVPWDFLIALLAARAVIELGRVGTVEEMASRLQRLDERYGSHHRDRQEFVFGADERAGLIADLVGGPGLEVLDIGCRTGALTQHYAAENTVVGVDVDHAALERAAARLEIETVWADVEEELPFADQTFDVVVAGEVLEHLADPVLAVEHVQRGAEARRTFRRLRTERVSPQEPAARSRRTAPGNGSNALAALLSGGAAVAAEPVPERQDRIRCRTLPPLEPPSDGARAGVQRAESALSSSCARRLPRIVNATTSARRRVASSKS